MEKQHILCEPSFTVYPLLYTRLSGILNSDWIIAPSSSQVFMTIVQGHFIMAFVVLC